jgi:hypothetical protein
MSQEIWVMKATYEKNASDGISYHTSKSDLAESVMQAEDSFGHVQVYKCVPVAHEAYTQRAGIEISDLK